MYDQTKLFVQEKYKMNKIVIFDFLVAQPREYKNG